VKLHPQEILAADTNSMITQRTQCSNGNENPISVVKKVVYPQCVGNVGFKKTNISLDAMLLQYLSL